MALNTKPNMYVCTISVSYIYCTLVSVLLCLYLGWCDEMSELIQSSTLQPVIVGATKTSSLEWKINLP